MTSSKHRRRGFSKPRQNGAPALPSLSEKSGLKNEMSLENQVLGRRRV